MANGKLAALAGVVIFCAGTAHAACDAPALVEQCKGKLEAGYEVLNTYELDGAAKETDTFADDHVLTSSMSYQVAICGGDDVEFVLETGARKPLLDNKGDGGLQQMVTINVERASVYYLVFKAPSQDVCAGAVLGMKR